MKIITSKKLIQAAQEREIAVDLNLVLFVPRTANRQLDEAVARRIVASIKGSVDAHSNEISAEIGHRKWGYKWIHETIVDRDQYIQDSLEGKTPITELPETEPDLSKIPGEE